MIKPSPKNLVTSIVSSIQEKKGDNIVTLDLTELDSKVCDYFVICNADSNTQVRAIADFIEENVREELGEKIWKKEGHDNSQWILLDYTNVVVHIFQTEYRDFYKLEKLWGDAKITKINLVN